MIGKVTSARMEGISPSTDINTSKVGRESDKNEFLKAKCYSLPMLRGTIILRDISRGLELHLLNAVLGQHYTKNVFPTNATRYTQLSRTQFSFA